jgi:hypothetical protein
MVAVIVHGIIWPANHGGLEKLIFNRTGHVIKHPCCLMKSLVNLRRYAKLMNGASESRRIGRDNVIKCSYCYALFELLPHQPNVL